MTVGGIEPYQNWSDDTTVGSNGAQSCPSKGPTILFGVGAINDTMGGKEEGVRAQGSVA